MIDLKETKVGDIVYHCLPSDEEGGFNVYWPRAAKVARIYENYDRLYVCGFDQETGAIDDDANACSTAHIGVLFKTKDEAFKYFIERQLEIIAEANELIRKANDPASKTL